MNQKDNRVLNAHVDAGKVFQRYQQLFKMLKKKDGKFTSTWKSWLNEKVKACRSYVYRHIQMYELCNQYPGLHELNTSYTQLFSMKGKIKRVFLSNTTLADEWLYVVRVGQFFATTYTTKFLDSGFATL